MTTAAVFVASFLLSVPRESRAGSLYIETAGGPAKFQRDASFFGGAASGASGIGYAINAAFLVDLGNNNPIEFQFGFQNRLSAATDGPQNELLEAIYPIVRLQITRIYLSVGATPLLWSRTQPAPGFDQLTTAHSTLSYLAEAGLLWPITPEFSLGAAASAQFVHGTAGLSPSPAMDGTVLMRFYFGYFGHAGDESSDEFKGWRYPFGHIR